MSLTNLLAHDRNVILYRPELNKITGNPLATILLSQIIYWSKIYDYDEFYKNIFVSNKRAKENKQKCWSEELGFSRRQIATAFKLLRGKEIVDVRVNSLEHNTYIKLNRKELNKRLKVVYEDPKGEEAPECTKRTTGDGRNVHSGVPETYIPTITENTQRLHKEGVENSSLDPAGETDLRPTANRIRKLFREMSDETKIKIQRETEEYLKRFPVLRTVKPFRRGILYNKIKKYSSA